MKRHLIGFLFLSFSVLLFAHESRPLFIKIVEDDTHLVFEISLPNTVNTQNFPIVYLDTRAINEAVKWSVYESGFRQKIQVSKALSPLRGSTVHIKYPAFNPVISTIVGITFIDKEEQITIIPPNSDMLQIPKEARVSEVRWQYSFLGIEHIWSGIDHLLFVFCLFIITGFSRKLFITITGFTIAHSFTLVLSALKVIQLPIPPIEATIALSIVFLCYEIIHHHIDKNSLTYRYPILVATSFGLLHGLGFAAVLGEIGLPNRYTVEALLFFNIGVEVGQILFLGLLFILIHLGMKIGNALLSKDRYRQLLATGLRISIYFVGIVATYWMFDRII